MRTNTLLAVATALLIGGLSAGCGATDADPASATEPSSGTVGDMSAAEMADMDGHDMEGMNDDDAAAPADTDASVDGPQPTDAATMICSDEIGHAIERAADLDAMPANHHLWIPPVYTCVWHLENSRLTMSVDDVSDPKVGEANFEELRASVDGAEDLPGMQSFGLPAFEASSGVVGFLKDGKSLLVDARALTPADLPADFTRQEVAYAVASAVIACWTE